MAPSSRISVARTARITTTRGSRDPCRPERQSDSPGFAPPALQRAGIGFHGDPGGVELVISGPGLAPRARPRADLFVLRFPQIALVDRRCDGTSEALARVLVVAEMDAAIDAGIGDVSEDLLELRIVVDQRRERGVADGDRVPAFTVEAPQRFRSAAAQAGVIGRVGREAGAVMSGARSSPPPSGRCRLRRRCGSRFRDATSL